MNYKAFGAIFLFWVDFKNAHSDRSSFNPFIWGRLLLRPEFHSNCEFFKNSAVICFNTIWAEFCSEFHIVISKYFESNSYGSWLQLLWFMTHPFFNWFPGINDYSNLPIIPQILSGVLQEFQLKQITSAIVILDSWHRQRYTLHTIFLQ